MNIVEWRRRNPGLERARQKARYSRNREVIKRLKAVPCVDCGKQYPYYVMDFDHRDGEGKTKMISRMTTGSMGIRLAEIAKCDVVCSNCHRERTYRRMEKRSCPRRV